MKRMIGLVFSELLDKVLIELDDSQSPKTVAVIIDSLPTKIMINSWGDELYSDAIPARVGEENAKAVVEWLDVAYQPEGSAYCLFHAPTPVIKQGQILPYWTGNMIGRMTTSPANLHEFLKSVEELHIHKDSNSDTLISYYFRTLNPKWA